MSLDWQNIIALLAVVIAAIYLARRSWQALYAGLAKLTSDLMEHIHLENNVLFPRYEGTP